MKNIVFNLSLLFITLILILFFAEVALRITYPFYKNYNTEMWRYASELKMLSDNPERGHEHVPNKSFVLYGVSISTNSLGFRSDREYSQTKKENVIRILVMGDSITVGWGVQYSQTYPKLLEDLLNKGSKDKRYEVINTGVGNYNSVNELETLKKYIYLNPDIIIVGFYINDIEKVKYPSKLFYFFMKNSYLYAFIGDKIINAKFGKSYSYQEYYGDLYKDEYLRGRFRKAVREIDSIAKEHHIPVLFVNIPEFHRFRDYPFPQVNSFLENDILAQTSVYYINLLPYFINETPEKLWVSHEDPHPNAEGHKIIARSLYKFMRDKKIINASPEDEKMDIF
jgi:lysophospholipase L1-like esterase